MIVCSLSYGKWLLQQHGRHGVCCDATRFFSDFQRDPTRDRTEILSDDDKSKYFYCTIKSSCRHSTGTQENSERYSTTSNLQPVSVDDVQGVATGSIILLLLLLFHCLSWHYDDTWRGLCGVRTAVRSTSFCPERIDWHAHNTATVIPVERHHVSK